MSSTDIQRRKSLLMSSGLLATLGTTRALAQTIPGSPVFQSSLYVNPPTVAGVDSTPSLQIEQNWNTSGTPTALKLDVNDLASSGDSLLLDLQRNGSSLFRIGKSKTTIGDHLEIRSNGQDSTFIGRDAGASNNTPSPKNGIYNTFVGAEAGKFNTSGYAGAFFGFGAGRNNTTGVANTFIGYQAGYSNTTGLGNVFIGTDAGLSSERSSGSVIIGFHAGMYLNPPSGYAENVIVGNESGYSASTARANTFVGNRTGYSTSTGQQNVFIGRLSGFANTSGSLNTFVGESAGVSSTTGQGNTLIGARAGYRSTTSGANTAVGQIALFNNISGSKNTALGYAAGFSNQSGSSNVFLGFQAGYYETGSNRLYIDNIARAGETDARAKALVYGVFGASAGTQSIAVNGKFACNSAEPQAPAVIGQAATDLQSLLTLINQIREALIANGICR